MIVSGASPSSFARSIALSMAAFNSVSVIRHLLQKFHRTSSIHHVSRSGCSGVRNRVQISDIPLWGCLLRTPSNLDMVVPYLSSITMRSSVKAARSSVVC
jgi:hypothetical protein